MALILFAVLFVGAITADAQKCFKYDETHGKHTESLGLTANGCRDIYEMKQPEEAHCVLKPYGAVDEDWSLHCPVFLEFIKDYIFDQTRSEEMKMNAYDNCKCKENIEDEKEREKYGRQFIKCWKGGLDKTCPEDAELVKDKITV